MEGTRDFGEFFSCEHERLLHYCWGLTVDADQAAEVASEAMARAYVSWGDLSGWEARPEAWVRTVALNLVRSRWRRDATAAAHPVAGSLAAVDCDGAEQLARDLDLEAALRALPGRQREAVVLHHLLDMSVLDCAEVMGVSEPTVKAHLQRGRAALAVALADVTAPATEEAR